MNFDELPTEKKQTEEPSSEIVETSEAKKEVMEGAKNERFKLAFSVLKKLGKLTLHGIDIIPPFGSLKMLPEMVIGTTAAGDKLSKKDRIMYGLIILHSFIYTTLFTHGVLKGNVDTILLSAPIYAITVGLTIKQKGSQVKKDIPEFILKYGESLNQHLVNSKKIIEEYGYENTKKLIERMRGDKKSNDNK